MQDKETLYGEFSRALDRARFNGRITQEEFDAAWEALQVSLKTADYPLSKRISEHIDQDHPCKPT